jgi:hypothetical protein
MVTPLSSFLAVLWRARLALVVATATAFLATAAAAPAYNIERGIERWPGKTITYYPAVYKKAVDTGAKAWNDAHVGVKFKRTSNRKKANFVVEDGSFVHACEGVSLVGYQGKGVQSTMWLGRPCNLNGGDDREFMIVTVTHELGHILGLGHEKHKCARMNASADYPTGTPGKCNYHSRSYWLKHLLKGDDIAGAKALYGG